MIDFKGALLALLKERSFKKGTFKLSSGGVSNYYLDGRLTSLCSLGIALISEILYAKTVNLNIDAVGGLETGAIPIIAATVMGYDPSKRPIEGFWVRQKPKEHGTKQLIEGNLQPNSRVAIVDDVVTSGSSLLKVVEAVREINCEIVLVTALVDRLAGARELMESHQVNCYDPIFTIKDFGIED